MFQATAVSLLEVWPESDLPPATNVSVVAGGEMMGLQRIDEASSAHHKLASLAHIDALGQLAGSHAAPLQVVNGIISGADIA